MWRSVRFMPGYIKDAIKWYKSDKTEKEHFGTCFMPTLGDKFLNNGVASGHYFHQDLWAARRVYSAAPDRHIDVGSRIDGFVAHLLTFRDVEVVDIRPLVSAVDGLVFVQADLMDATVPNIPQASSVSCLHALEHFGLGRYGDPIVPNGWRIGLKNVASLVAANGTLYLGVPVGRPMIEFNAQRIFDPKYIIAEAALYGLKLEEFSFVNDSGEACGPLSNLDRSLAEAAQLDYGCGLFIFKKEASS
jgi:hypothetical protein